MISAVCAGQVNEIGIIRAMAIGGPSPGMAPTTSPTTMPISRQERHEIHDFRSAHLANRRLGTSTDSWLGRGPLTIAFLAVLALVVGLLLWWFAPGLDRAVRSLTVGYAGSDPYLMTALSAASGERAAFIVGSLVGAGFAYARRDWRPGVAVMIAFLATLLVGDVLKVMFERTCPVGRTPGRCFPSAHAAQALVIWGFVYWAVPRSIGTPRLQVLARITVVLVFIGTVLSRLFLDTHWATDVVAGLGLGGLGLTLAIVGARAPVGRRARRIEAGSRRTTS